MAFNRRKHSPRGNNRDPSDHRHNVPYNPRYREVEYDSYRDVAHERYHHSERRIIAPDARYREDEFPYYYDRPRHDHMLDRRPPYETTHCGRGYSAERRNPYGRPGSYRDRGKPRNRDSSRPYNRDVSGQNLTESVTNSDIVSSQEALTPSKRQLIEKKTVSPHTNRVTGDSSKPSSGISRDIEKTPTKKLPDRVPKTPESESRQSKHSVDSDGDGTPRRRLSHDCMTPDKRPEYEKGTRSLDRSHEVLSRSRNITRTSSIDSPGKHSIHSPTGSQSMFERNADRSSGNSTRTPDGKSKHSEDGVGGRPRNGDRFAATVSQTSGQPFSPKMPSFNNNASVSHEQRSESRSTPSKNRERNYSGHTMRTPEKHSSTNLHRQHSNDMSSPMSSSSQKSQESVRTPHKHSKHQGNTSHRPSMEHHQTPDKCRHHSSGSGKHTERQSSSEGVATPDRFFQRQDRRPSIEHHQTPDKRRHHSSGSGKHTDRQIPDEGVTTPERFSQRQDRRSSNESYHSPGRSAHSTLQRQHSNPAHRDSPKSSTGVKTPDRLVKDSDQGSQRLLTGQTSGLKTISRERGNGDHQALTPLKLGHSDTNRDRNVEGRSMPRERSESLESESKDSTHGVHRQDSNNVDNSCITADDKAKLCGSPSVDVIKTERKSLFETLPTLLSEASMPQSDKGKVDSGPLEHVSRGGDTSPDINNDGDSEESDSSMLSDEDDMEMLGAVKWLQEASSRPVHISPVKCSPSTPSLNGQSVRLQLLKVDSTIAQQKRVSHHKISIDDILAEKVTEENEELVRIKDDLREGIKLGGINKISEQTFSDEEMIPEHENQLKSLKIKEKEIKECHPGESIFESQRFGQIFTCETLTLSRCGFEAVKHLDKRLCRMSQDSLDDLVTSDVLMVCFHSFTHPSAVLRWLFFAMSVHPNSLVSDGIKNTLVNIFNNQRLSGEAATWVPSLQDIMAVFVNYGASLGSLTMEAETDCFTFTESTIRQETLKPTHVTRDTAQGSELGYSMTNLNNVVQILTYALDSRLSSYTLKDLFTLFLTLLRVALDVTYKETYKGDIQSCLAMILEAFPEENWLDTVSSLCQIIANHSTHHHNKVVIVQLLPLTDRGRYLRRRVSYAILCSLLFDGIEFPVEEIQDIKVAQLLNVVPVLDTTEETNYYHLASVISLMDLTVGSEVFNAQEKREVKELIPKVKEVINKMKDRFNHLDRSRVKDMLVRIVSKWSLMVHGVSRQRKIFEYHCSPKKKMVIEPVEAK